MNRELKFRGWTGKEMYYQEDQYLGSFVRRFVQRVTSGPDHESYLPNGGNIDEYLMQYTGLKANDGTEIYEFDRLRMTRMFDFHEVSYNEDAHLHASSLEGYCSLPVDQELEWEWIGNVVFSARHGWHLSKATSFGWRVVDKKPEQFRTEMTVKQIKPKAYNLDVVGHVYQNPELLVKAGE